MQEHIGRTVGHYRIVEQIGAGGMGVVYRAHDERLDRDVAIKVLPEEFGQDPDRLARFEREAKAVAALSHPNILEIFDFDTEDGVTFAVTELLEGETLRERMQKVRGWLPWRKVQEIGAAVANGLGAAHSKGVVHRDIKPSNIFLCSDGRVKILDFGLAATREAVDSEAETGTFEAPLTGAGKVMGTVGYMSPEQVRGEPADHRTDIFALGCVLYEMLTGNRAFKRDTTAEIMTAILREEPMSFADSGAQIPPEVVTAVQHCLEKKPDRRYQSAADLAFELENILGDPTGPSRTEPVPSRRRRRIALVSLAAVLVTAIGITISFQALRTNPAQPAQTDVSEPKPDRNLLLVVPFENRTGDPELDALGFEATSRIGDSLRGRTIEKLIANLGVEITEPVGSRETTALLGLAASRNAGTVLSGSISRQQDSLRFEARLTDALQQQAGPAIESVVMSVKTPDAAIEELQQRILALVYWQLSTKHSLLATPKPPRWEAIQEWRARTADHDPTDISPYLRALEIDPDFHALWWSISVRYGNAGMYPEAREALDRLDEHTAKLSSYGRHLSAAARAILDGNLSAVYFQYKQASRLEPRADLRSRIASSAMAIGRPREAVTLFTERLAEDTDLAPPGPYYYWELAEAHCMLHQYEESIEVARNGRTVFPSSAMIVWREAAGLAALGRLEELDRLVDDCQTIQFSDPEGAGYVMGMAVTTLRRYGYNDEALKTAERAVEWYRGRSGTARLSWRYRIGFADALYRAERWEEARTLFLSLAEEAGDIRPVLRGRDSRPMYVHASLGLIAARLGNREEAERISALFEGVDGFTIGRPEVFRACIASALGQPDRAFHFVKQALADGLALNRLFWENYDLDDVWDEPEFQELLRPKG